MKEYKQNITIPFVSYITYIFIFMIPSVMILWMIFYYERTLEAIITIPSCLIILGIIYILEEIVNLFGKISKKHIVKLSENKIFYDEKEIKYEFVDKIIFEKGICNKFNKGMSSALILFNGDQVLLNIKNPSIIVVYLINKRCVNKQNSLINKKLLLIIGLFYGLTLLTWLILVLINL